MNSVKIKPRKGRPSLAQRGSAGKVRKTIKVPEGRPSSHTHSLVSKKLRALMNLVAIEPPALGIAPPGKTLELPDILLGIIPAGERLQVVADQLIPAGP